MVKSKKTSDNLDDLDGITLISDDYNNKESKDDVVKAHDLLTTTYLDQDKNGDMEINVYGVDVSRKTEIELNTDINVNNVIKLESTSEHEMSIIRDLLLIKSRNNFLFNIKELISVPLNEFIKSCANVSVFDLHKMYDLCLRSDNTRVYETRVLIRKILNVLYSKQYTKKDIYDIISKTEYNCYETINLLEIAYDQYIRIQFLRLDFITAEIA